jgi:hypothetical protein
MVDSVRVPWVPLYRFPTLSLGAFAMYVAFPPSDSYAPSDCLQGLGAFGAGLSCLLSTLLTIPCRLSRVRQVELKQDGGGGTFSWPRPRAVAPQYRHRVRRLIYATCGRTAPVFCLGLYCRNSGFELDWLAS